MQITAIELPDTHINVGDAVRIGVKINANEKFSGELTLTDFNGLTTETVNAAVNVNKGEQTVFIDHAFTSGGLHELHCNVTLDGVKETVIQNNDYYAYEYLAVYNKVLVYESELGQSTALESILTEDEAFDVTVVNILDEDIPTTLEELLRYDQIIMNNVSFSDISGHEDLEENIYAFVRDYGGGLFTVGGNDSVGEAHAYNRKDMIYSNYYRQLLPIEAIKYTPPVAVMILIDRSGSMGQDIEGSNFWYAKAGAASCVNALTERDYIGAMTFDDAFQMVLPLTPRTQETKIFSSIDKLTAGGTATVFPGAIEKAGMELRDLKNVDKRHIIIVTDGGVTEDQRPDYESLIDNFYKTDGITFSTVLIGGDKDAIERMTYASETLGHGKLYNISDNSTLMRIMREDLNAPEIEELSLEPFHPVITDILSPVVKGVETVDLEGAKNSMTMELQGFYGVRARNSASTVITGPYGVPLYSYWKFGNGSVGSFMSDLNGNWSSELLVDESGKTLVKNILNGLMPLSSIREEEVSARLTEGNYSNHVSVFTPLEEGERYGGSVTDMSGNTVSLSQLPTDGENAESADNINPAVYATVPFSEANAYSRAEFVVKEGGVYTVKVDKLDSDGKILQTITLYKAFSYSQEFDVYGFSDPAAITEKLNNFATIGKGSVIADLDDPHEVFDGFELYVDRVFDPRLLFIIIIIVAFLLDIIVRKFKFKWPHEIIIERNKKKNEKKVR